MFTSALLCRNGRIFYIIMGQKKICVFCSSNDALNKVHRETAYLLGRSIGEAGFALVWGGCDMASMGDVARGVQAAGGRVTGVITQHFIDRGLVFSPADEMILVSNLGERKKLMQELSDGFVVLPGGFGTLDELFDVIASQTLRMKSGEALKPIVIVNSGLFFDRLESFFEYLYKENVADESYRRLYSFVDSPKSAIDHLHKSFMGPILPG